MDIPTIDDREIPRLTTSQMVEVDRAMMEDYGISLMQMMENAGRGLAYLARERFLSGDPRGRRIVALTGTGGNGGGALVAARRLNNYGAQVTVITTREAAAFTPVPAHQLAILRRMGVPIHEGVLPDGLPTADLVLDGLIGYSLRGAPRGTAAGLIRWATGQPAPVLALDVPSGLDAAGGAVYDPAIRAAATMTLALPKVGLDDPAAAGHVGELYLADISVPPELYAGPGLELAVGPLFATADILRCASRRKSQRTIAWPQDYSRFERPVGPDSFPVSCAR